MTDLASPEWLAALDARLHGIAVTEPRAGTLPVVVELRIGTPDAPVQWHLVVAADGARVVAGAAPDPTLTVSTDPDTLEALRRGSINAQRAVDAGVLRLRGDLNHLAAAGPALAAVAAALHDRAAEA